MAFGLCLLASVLAVTPFVWCCCAAPCTTGQITVTLLGCNSLALPGATVVLKLGGSTLATQTTDGSGVTVFTGLSPGTYTVTYSRTRFSTVGPVNVTIDSVCTAMTEGATMSPASGYNCCVACTYPVATTLHLTTSSGTVSLTFSVGRWTGTQSGIPYDCTADGGVGTAGTVTLTYVIPCSAGGTFGDLLISGLAGKNFGTPFLVQDTVGCLRNVALDFTASTSASPSSAPCAEPIAFSYTVPGTMTGSGGTLTCPIAGAASATE